MPGLPWPAWCASLTLTSSRRCRIASARLPCSQTGGVAVPVKLRIAKERRPAFSHETLELFRALEATPARRRHTPKFKDGVHQLARLLEQTDEYWTGNSVLDR